MKSIFLRLLGKPTCKWLLVSEVKAPFLWMKAASKPLSPSGALKQNLIVLEPQFIKK